MGGGWGANERTTYASDGERGEEDFNNLFSNPAVMRHTCVPLLFITLASIMYVLCDGRARWSFLTHMTRRVVAVPIQLGTRKDWTFREKKKK